MTRINLNIFDATHFRASILAIMIGLPSPITAHDFNFSVGNDAYQAEDYDVALREWEPLAAAGVAAAQFNVGLMYYHGQGVPQDFVKAVKWYQLAAEQEFIEAQNHLGTMYFNGRGIPQDYLKAVKWYRLAAEQGNSNAQLNLGILNEYGKGVLQDNVMAHMWYSIASANGQDQAGGYRDERAGLMTPADLSKAQAMARKCMSSGYTKCGY